MHWAAQTRGGPERKVRGMIGKQQSVPPYMPQPGIELAT